jgi:8-oxo-dGTP pyrophosphatase MutT (NUDIX family)
MARATFAVGVFGLACWNDSGTLRIKVNVRTDQEAQRKKASAADPNIKFVDLPGGGVELKDLSSRQSPLLDALRREIAEETGGCSIEPVGDFSAPYLVVSNAEAHDRPAGDLAFWMPVVLKGRPRPSAEALDHPWLSLQQVEAETEYRVVAGLNNAGRSGRMLRAAFAFYQGHMGNAGYFSVPE